MPHPFVSRSYVSRVVGTDETTGFEVAVNNDGDAFYVTPCCGASAKGCDGYTGCRACYAEVDPGLGGVPDPVWFAPQHRQRVEDFDNFIREIVNNALNRKDK